MVTFCPPTGRRGAGKIELGESGCCRCVLASITAVNLASSRQNQFGVTQCASGATIDGTCSSTSLFVETYQSPTYTCYPHGGASLGSQYSLRIRETSVGSNVFQAFLSAGGGFESVNLLSGTSRTFAWLEVTATGACDASWSGSATFSRFSRCRGVDRVSSGSSWSGPGTYGTCASKTALSSGGFSAGH
jgi:hypothetical protein